MDSVPEALTIKEVQRLLPRNPKSGKMISRREIELRMASDPLAPGHLAWIPRPDGKRGRLVLFRGLPEKVRKQVWEEVRNNLAGKGKPDSAPQATYPLMTKALNTVDSVKSSVQAPPKPAGSEQCIVNSEQPNTATRGQQTFGFAQVDPEIRAAVQSLAIPPEQAPLVQFRKEFVTLSLNHKWRAEGSQTFRDYMGAEIEKARAAGIRNISYRSVLRWRLDYQREGVKALVDIPPGPKPMGARIEPWQVSYIEDCCGRGMGQEATFRALVKETQSRQAGCGLDYRYIVPSLWTVRRAWQSYRTALQEAAVKGEAHVKAACGYLDRTYAHLAVLDVVEIDEWESNVWAYDAEAPLNAYRYWLLVAYDQRSMYPLVWKLVRGRAGEKRHGITEEDEIALLERLIRAFGVPKSIYSDRGRFRGRTYEARKKREAEFARADTLWEQLGIAKGGPREENPEASRIHPFFRWMSDGCIGLAGYCGKEPKDPWAAKGWATRCEHIEWAKGNRGRGTRSPYLLSHLELLPKLEKVIADWREHPSDGTDMRGLAPRAVFTHATPEGGFQRLSEEDLAIKFAETFEETIERGGVITLPDGKRYGNMLLADIPGECRVVKRLRHEKSFILVLPTRADGEYLIADLRQRFGADPVALGAEIERQKRLRKAVMAYYGQAPGSGSSVGPSPSADGSAWPNAVRPYMAAAPIPVSPVPMTEERAEGKSTVDSRESIAIPAPEIELMEAAADEAAPSLYDYSEAGEVEKL